MSMCLVDETDSSGKGSSVSSMGNMGGLNGLAGGLGESVLDVRAGDLGDGVAVLNLDGHDLDLGVLDTVLGGDLVASVLDGGDSRVGNSLGNGSNVGNRSMSIGGAKTSIEDGSISIGISFGLSLSLPLGNVSNGRSSMDSSNGRSSMEGSNGSRSSVTDGVNNILADFLVFDLLGVDKFLGANVLGGGNAGLGHEDLVLNLAVGGGGGNNWGSGKRTSSKRTSSKWGSSKRSSTKRSSTKRSSS